jgi:hypothetical protein
MTYKEPGKPMTAEQVAAALAVGFVGQPSGQGDAVDLYERKTYQVLLDRGMPAAQAKEKAEFWAALKRSDPTGEVVIGPADDPLAHLSHDASITTDPVTGAKVYSAAYRPGAYAAATISGASGRPSSIMERPRNRWLSGATEIDRFSLNPGRDSVLQQLSASDLVGPAPEMFNSGPLPILTGSGVDPQDLRWVGWQLRHTAAFATSRSHVLELIEASLEPGLDESLQSEIGRAHLDEYFGRVQTWAATLPEGESLQNLTPAEIARHYPDGPDDSGAG